ncbi:pseudaminic acid cytidylyltransferase [Marinobacter sp. 71-i]|uniref:Pseudaminic acid cytidylyltransferase n=1 Tax=Marinobacter iranensis TaxID=2962607 RepID=A0ABT5YCG5_9GAMM|nr:pseudaminic acid cytidylyltransferase [Marinobacter iranensis]MDF0751264.1 pseudaminic acid cytidylyltransferase [Marinobacter iranensis]
MRLAVIPARGGSKRIPGKNIKEFCGKPMIAWSIEAALESDCFDRVIVSTDSGEIAEVSKQHGAEIPFFRPSSLADDLTGTLPVMAHAVESLIGAAQEKESLVCCIYATAPFVRPDDIARGHDNLVGSEADYAFSVTTYPFPIQRSLRMTSSGRVDMFWPEHFHTRSQDLEEAWHDAGQFYWGRAEAWARQSPLFSPRSIPIVLPRHRVQDIDSGEDWIRAEYMFRALLAESGNK